MDFSNIHLEKDEATNYYNATQLVKFSHKKNLNTWVRIRMGIDALLNRRNWCDCSYKSGNDLFVDKDLILDLADWISPEYYMKCWMIINNME